MTLNSLFSGLPSGADPAAEFIEILATAEAPGSLRVERILSPWNHASPPGFWYDEETTEWVLLLQGSATLRFRDSDGFEETLDLLPGDWLEIPAHRRHRVDVTSGAEPTLWLAIHWE